MSSFPPSKWEVRFVKDMHSMSCEAPDDDDDDDGGLHGAETGRG